MLNSLEIKNFQAHKHLFIEFDKGVNSIVGPTDVGKSAIIRALQWVTTNEPSGEAFIKEGTKKAAARVVVDGNKITRIRGKGKNAYRLNNSDYNAFGSNVPETIASLLNLSDLNFQAQHDSPFWFCKTAGEVSRQLNSIVDLDIIDTALADLSSDVKKQKSSTDVLINRIKRLEELEKSSKFLEDVDKDLLALEEQEKEIQEKRQKIDTLQELIQKCKTYQKRIDTAFEFISSAKCVINAGEKWNSIHKKTTFLTGLVELGKRNLKAAKNRPPSIEPLEALWNTVEFIKEEQDTLSKILSKILMYKRVIEQSQIDIKKLKISLKEKMGDTCPLCEQPLS